MSIWQHVWSLLDAYLLRVFDTEQAALVRTIAEPLPDETRDLPTTLN